MLLLTLDEKVKCMTVMSKIIVVEGKTDKMKLLEVLSEPVHIVCTNGTMGYEKLDALLEEITGHKVYIMTDADKAGDKIRSWFKRHLSESHHIYINPKYGEVGKCPVDYLTKLMTKHTFEVKELTIANEYQRLFAYELA